MTFTDRDMENISYIQSIFDLDQGVYAISRALEISKQLIELESKGNKLLLENKKREISQINLINE